MSTKLSSPAESTGGDLPLTEFLTYKLLGIVQMTNRAGARWHLAHTGLPLGEWRILAILGYFGPSTSRRICERLAMDKAAVSRVKSRLVERGLVRERTLPEDSRKRLLELTPSGQALYEKIIPLAQARQRAILDLMSDDELAAFHRVLDKLSDHFQG